MRSSNRLDALLLRVVRPLSVAGIVALAGAVYIAGGLALPLVLQWPVPVFVASNFFATVLSWLLFVVWVSIQVEAGTRRHLLEWTTDLRLLTAAEFEWLVGELFRREGWRVHETGRQDGPDGNIDLRLTRGDEIVLVQCKRWVSRLIGVAEIRAFAGTLMREGVPGGCGAFVTLSGFTEQAIAEARDIGLILVDNVELFRRIERVRRTEPCPICGSAMQLARSQYGWWFRCVVGPCAGKRDLGRDPGRAVELMTLEGVAPHD